MERRTTTPRLATSSLREMPNNCRGTGTFRRGARRKDRNGKEATVPVSSTESPPGVSSPRSCSQAAWKGPILVLGRRNAPFHTMVSRRLVKAWGSGPRRRHESAMSFKRSSTVAADCRARLRLGGGAGAVPLGGQVFGAAATGRRLAGTGSIFAGEASESKYNLTAHSCRSPRPRRNSATPASWGCQAGDQGRPGLEDGPQSHGQDRQPACQRGNDFVVPDRDLAQPGEVGGPLLEFCDVELIQSHPAGRRGQRTAGDHLDGKTRIHSGTEAVRDASAHVIA